MSASNGTLHVPSAGTHFQLPDGRTFELSLVAADKRTREITQATGEQGGYAYLEQFGQWVLDQAGVELSQDQLSWLWNTVQIERARAGRDFFDTLKSLTSTDSTPSA